MKFAVGAVNAVRGVIGVTSGLANVSAGVALEPISGGLSTGMIAFGSGQVVLGLGGVNRGARQMSEATEDRHGASFKNLLGLFPMGQEYDDPLEPGMVDFFKQRYREIVSDPVGAGKQTLCDVLAIRCSTETISQQPPSSQEPPRREQER